MKFEIQSETEQLEIRRAVDRICDEFESAWHQDSKIRIEDVYEDLPKLLQPLDVDAKSPDVVEKILAELIHVEMDLRFAAQEAFDEFEYLARFPDFADVIAKAVERIKNLDTDHMLNSYSLVATVVANSSPNGDLEIKLAENAKESLPSELGPFHSISPIGSGGFGVVCRATDSRSNIEVALKFPRQTILTDNQLLSMFLEEATRAENLDHPGIVRTHAVLQQDGYLAIVQQLIVGTDLKNTLDQPRTHKEIADLIATIADALGYAGSHGIVHRDLKPSNVLLDEQGRPYIADFGMALHESVQLDTPNQRCGTPPYMSPQLVAGLTKNLDGRTDIWSLGIILYEMLAGKRPFRGRTVEEIYQQIETRDPKPLRQIDPTIDRELERICLKCLARPARERYLTADDLADDLRHWIASPAPTAASRKAAFIPKGLRSYGSEDASFFLSLLPGPRDRDGTPASVRFWQVKFCDSENIESPVPVGVIYGPSGSGKSSFVKAGLIPKIKSIVEAIYIESTQADTEVRLIKALREHFPSIPENISLPAMLSGLSHRRWQSPSQKKILLVLDQFEQRLSVADDFNQAQLVKALRHCDGRQLQCLLLVRDDFWLALTRFTDSLEMDLREGENSQDIDLFDRDHAKNVLIKLGRAYDRLPDASTSLTKEQNAFLDLVVDQLAVGNYVICVRMTLFAEMFKSRPWTMAELKSVGGIRGVGEKFLEETFGDGSQSRRNKLQTDSVLAILESLLPEEGLDIRGAMQSESDLQTAANLGPESENFKTLIKTLDYELRLITRTDPDSTTGCKNENRHESTGVRYYQLTHDYLVPSVRIWIETKRQETPKGRIRTRFSNLANRWNTEHDDRFLPTLVEFVQIQHHLSRHDLTASEQSLLRRSQTFHLMRVACAALIFALVTTLVGFAIQRQNKKLAREYVDRFITGHPEALLSNVLLMQQHPRHSSNLLSNKLASIEIPDQQLRATLGLALLGNRQQELLTKLVDSIRPDCDANARSIVTALQEFPTSIDRIIDRYTQLENKEDLQSSQIRARLAITLCFLGNVNWVANRIVDESTDFQTLFVHTINKWHGNLNDITTFLKSDSPETANALLCLAIGKLQNNGRLSTQVIDLITPQIKQLYECCQSSYLLSSAEWSLKRLGSRPKPRENERTVNSLLNSVATPNFLWIDSLKMRMHHIKPRPVNSKTFMRGDYQELPTVIENRFYAADREITVADFYQFLNDETYQFEKPVEIALSQQEDRLPANRVSYIDAIMFCNWLSRKEGFKPAYQKLKSTYRLHETIRNDIDFIATNKVPLHQWKLVTSATGFRLPTYGEWQCLEKTNDSDYFDFGSVQMNVFVPDYAWLGSNSLDATGRSVLQIAKQKMPNRNGLFDIYGNAAEYCWDFPFRKFDPVASDVSFYVVGRGNNCTIQSAQLNPFKCEILLPVTRSLHTGFRIIIGIPDAP